MTVAVGFPTPTPALAPARITKTPDTLPTPSTADRSNFSTHQFHSAKFVIQNMADGGDRGDGDGDNVGKCFYLFFIVVFIPFLIYFLLLYVSANHSEQRPRLMTTGRMVSVHIVSVIFFFCLISSNIFYFLLCRFNN